MASLHSDLVQAVQGFALGLVIGFAIDILVFRILKWLQPLLHGRAAQVIPPESVWTMAASIHYNGFLALALLISQIGFGLWLAERLAPFLNTTRLIEGIIIGNLVTMDAHREQIFRMAKPLYPA